MSELELHHAAALPAPQGGAMPTSLEWQSLERMATTLAESALVPYKLRGKPADIAVILLAAREYGVPPLMALSKLPVINGAPAPMGELMLALIRRAGHVIKLPTFRNPDGTEYLSGPITPSHYGEVRFHRREDTELAALRFSIEEALTAGLIQRLEDGRAVATVVKNNGTIEPTPWQLYTGNMAKWRAVANAARLEFSDVLLGLSYLPEEQAAMSGWSVMVDENGAPIEGELADPQQRRTPAPTIEAKTAAETVERALTVDDPDTIVSVRRWFADKAPECLPLAVELAPDHRDLLRLAPGDAVTLDHFLERLELHLRAGLGALVMPEPAHDETPREEAAAPPPVDEPTIPGTDTPDAVEPAQEAAEELPTVKASDVTDEQLGRLANALLDEHSIEAVRDTYRRAPAELRARRVDHVTPGLQVDGDLRAALGAPPEDHIALGALLVGVASYLDKHGMTAREALVL